MTTITQPPPYPDIADPENFADEAQAWVQWLSDEFAPALAEIIGNTIPEGSAAAGTLTGNTLAPNVVHSSLTSLGTITSLVADAFTLAGAALGSWTARTYDGANFTGSASMTWTVQSGDVVTDAYTLTGKSITVAISINTSSVGGTPSTDLEIKIPASKTAAKDMKIGVARCLDDNVLTDAIASVSAGSTLIVVNRTDLGNWTSSTNQTRVEFVFTFEVQ